MKRKTQIHNTPFITRDGLKGSDNLRPPVPDREPDHHKPGVRGVRLRARFRIRPGEVRWRPGAGLPGPGRDPREPRVRQLVGAEGGGRASLLLLPQQVRPEPVTRLTGLSVVRRSLGTTSTSLGV